MKLAETLTDFAAAVGSGETVSGILHRLGDYCLKLLPIDGAGVLLDDGTDRLRFATASDQLGAMVEQLETELQEGPCVDCHATATQVLLPDLAQAGQAYPRFAPRAVEMGIRAVFALPMTMRTQRLGALDLLSRTPVQLTADDVAAAQMLADVGIAYIMGSRMFAEASGTAEQLRHALDSRVVIEQAKGKLAERLGIEPSAAFQVMRAYARPRELRLQEVAQAVMDGSLDLPVGDLG